jgi:hypothetical protein
LGKFIERIREIAEQTVTSLTLQYQAAETEYEHDYAKMEEQRKIKADRESQIDEAATFGMFTFEAMPRKQRPTKSKIDNNSPVEFVGEIMDKLEISHILNFLSVENEERVLENINATKRGIDPESYKRATKLTIAARIVYSIHTALTNHLGDLVDLERGSPPEAGQGR